MRASPTATTFFSSLPRTTPRPTPTPSPSLPATRRRPCQPPASNGPDGNGGTRHVDLVVDGFSRLSSYNVLRSTTSGSGFVSVATGSPRRASSYGPRPTAPPSSSSVTATNANGTSANSAQASATQRRVALWALPLAQSTVTCGQSGTSITVAPFDYRTSDTLTVWLLEFDCRTVSVTGRGGAETCGRFRFRRIRPDCFATSQSPLGQLSRGRSFFWFQ